MKKFNVFSANFIELVEENVNLWYSVVINKRNI